MVRREGRTLLFCVKLNRVTISLFKGSREQMLRGRRERCESGGVIGFPNTIWGDIIIVSHASDRKEQRNHRADQARDHSEPAHSRGQGPAFPFYQRGGKPEQHVCAED